MPDPTDRAPGAPNISLTELTSQFGTIDIYLFDQLLRGRITPRTKVFDAGCGRGRNLHYLLRAGVQVFGVDPDERVIEEVRALAARFAPELPTENFRAEPIEAMSFPDHLAGFVISNAVLHFARDELHFWRMLEGSWRVLEPGGVFFSRLASTIGIAESLTHLNGRRYRQPDGSERFLVDGDFLAHTAARLGGVPIDPLKTTVVQNLRSMTTWVLRKDR